MSGARSPLHTGLLYALFAVIATVANLASQRVSLAIYDGSFSILLAIFIGTGIGLVTKYVLDKYFIFQDQRSTVSDHSKQFGLYTLSGVGTTAIFWGMEYLFYYLWDSHLMREVGAVIGLAIGYTVKYRLDAKYVFRQEPLTANS